VKFAEVMVGAAFIVRPFAEAAALLVASSFDPEWM
jgi:hypothetical protein